MQNSPKRSYAKYLMSGTGLAMLVAFAAPVAVQAQEAVDDTTEVVIVGTRASQQSSIDRKRRAKTPTDSIVAEDVGAFPDKNIGEAISRIAGVALDRGDFGEGAGVTIRGSSSDLNRVEIDGLGVMATGGGNRGAEFRELSADLIKSVDVVKGTTADMTEGSLGGSVRIQSRTGLDFKKPYVSLRVGAQQNTISGSWKPDINFIGSRKFLNDRLGVLLNVTYSGVETNGHMARVSNGNATYNRIWDLDDSLEKTFVHNPSTADQTATSPLLRSALTGGGFLESESAISLLTKSAAAQSKDECRALFPMLTQGQVDSMSGNAAAKNNAQYQRVYEQMTCLNQWNDYTPSLPRYSAWQRDDERLNVDLRFDYRINSNLDVFFKYNINNRLINFADHNYSLGAPTVRTTLIPVTEGLEGYTQDTNIVGSQVDNTHHATHLTLRSGIGANGNVGPGFDAREFYQDNKTEYVSAGANWKSEKWTAEFLVGRGKSDFVMEQNGIGWSGTIPELSMRVTGDGLWTYDLPADFSQTNPLLYGIPLPATAVSNAQNPDAMNPDRNAAPRYVVADLPNRVTFGIQYTPQITENQETTLKLDITRDFTDIPFLTRIKGGVSKREYTHKNWGGGGYTPVAAQGTFGQPDFVSPVVVPRATIRNSIYICEPTDTSIASCSYGFNDGFNSGWVPHPNLGNALEGIDIFTTEQFREMVSNTMVPLPWEFFKGDPNRGELLKGWHTIDVHKALSYVNTEHFNLDCVKSCQGSDGQVYEQPYTAAEEDTTALYLLAEFEQNLPLGMQLTGNFGTRYVKTKMRGTGLLTINTISTTAGYNPSSPDDPNGIVTRTVSMNVATDGEASDWTQSYNLGLWILPSELVLRGYWGRVVARPPVTQLVPTSNASTNCTIDERAVQLDEYDNTCGRLGNPNLKPYAATNSSLNLEWYPNRDSQVSIGVFKNSIKTGAPMNGTLNNVDVFGNGLIFESLPSYVNGPGAEITGWEFASKTAFTFLPWYLRYTGADFNYSKLKGESIAVVDPLTGNQMPAQGQSNYFANLSFWYDDGRLNARVAYQARDFFFDRIANAGTDNATRNGTYNYPGYENSRLPYNPGAPIYRDKTEHLDAKISYKVRPEVQVAFEARNLLDQGNSRSQGSYNTFENGAQSLVERSFPGRRYMLSVTYRN